MSKKTDLDKLLDIQQKDREGIENRAQREWLKSGLGFPSTSFIKSLYELEVGKEYHLKELSIIKEPRSSLLDIVEKDIKKYIFIQKYGKEDKHYAHKYRHLIPRMQLSQKYTIKILFFPINNAMTTAQRALLYLWHMGEGPYLHGWLPKRITERREFNDYLDLWYNQFQDGSYTLTYEGKAALLDLIGALGDFTAFIISLNEVLEIINLIIDRNSPRIREKHLADESIQLQESKIRISEPAEAFFLKSKKKD